MYGKVWEAARCAWRRVHAIVERSEAIGVVCTRAVERLLRACSCACGCGCDMSWHQECEQRERRKALGLPYSASDQVRFYLSDSPLLAAGASVALRGFDCLVLSEWSCGGVEGCGRTNAAVSLDCLDCV